MIDYGVLPPEVNSGRMYTGPGAGPMLAAATAWDVLADEWSLTAAGFELTVTDLTAGPWRGPAALSMAAAALPFTVWLKTTAAHAEQAAGQAKAAVAAYETAFAMTVPPAVVAANRAQLMLLIATNFFGQNTAAIAATEAHYAEMWAQDAAAMYGYAGSSHAAAQVSPFTSPPQATNPAGPGGQAAAAGQGVGAAPPTSAMVSSPQALAQLGGSSGTAPTAPGAPAAVLPGLQKLLDQWSLLNRVTGSGFSPAPMAHAASQVLMIGDTFPKALSGAKDFLADGAKLVEGAAKSVGTASAVAPAVSAGTAAQIGTLSVPPSWPGAVPGATPAAATLVASRAATGAAAEAGAVARGGFGLPFLPGAAAAAGGGAGVGGFRFVPRYGYRHRVMTRPPHGG